MEDVSSWREMSLPYRMEPGEEPEEFNLLSVMASIKHKEVSSIVIDFD